MELPPDFDEFIASSTAHGVEFVVAGAYALAFHRVPRFSGALDILARPSLENAARSRARRGVRLSRSPSESRVIADRRRMLEMGVHLCRST